MILGRIALPRTLPLVLLCMLSRLGSSFVGRPRVSSFSLAVRDCYHRFIVAAIRHDSHDKNKFMSMSNHQDAASNDTTKARPLVIVLAGPTAVGKSDVAAQLCQSLIHHRGMIVSADSVQAYRGGSIGSNKPTDAELQATPHLLINVADAHHTYNAAEWMADAIYCIQRLTGKTGDNSTGTQQGEDTTTTVDDNVDSTTHDPTVAARRLQINRDMDRALAIKQKNTNNPTENNDDNPSVLPVVVGGTMMYLQWLVHGRPDAMRPTATALARAATTMQGYEHTSDWAGAVQHVTDFGPKFVQQVEKLSGRDWYRLRRILEVALTVQEIQGNNENVDKDKDDTDSLLEKLYSGQRQAQLSSFGFDVRCFFLCPTDRMVHSQVVDQRCEDMLQRGLLEETTDLACAGQLPDMATKAIGYRQVLDYLHSKDVREGDAAALVHFMEEFSTATRRYSKRQMQWFRRDQDFYFVPMALPGEYAPGKPARVTAAAQEIARLVALSREDFDRERNRPDGLNAQTRQANEAQGKKMRTYQFTRYKLTDGSKEFQDMLERADACRHRFQSKRSKLEATTNNDAATAS